MNFLAKFWDFLIHIYPFDPGGDGFFHLFSPVFIPPECVCCCKVCIVLLLCSVMWRSRELVWYGRVLISQISTSFGAPICSCRCCYGLSCCHQTSLLCAWELILHYYEKVCLEFLFSLRNYHFLKQVEVYLVCLCVMCSVYNRVFWFGFLLSLCKASWVWFILLEQGFRKYKWLLCQICGVNFFHQACKLIYSELQKVLSHLLVRFSNMKNHLRKSKLELSQYRWLVLTRCAKYFFHFFRVWSVLVGIKFHAWWGFFNASHVDGVFFKISW